MKYKISRILLLVSPIFFLLNVVVYTGQEISSSITGQSNYLGDFFIAVTFLGLFFLIRQWTIIMRNGVEGTKSILGSVLVFMLLLFPSVIQVKYSAHKDKKYEEAKSAKILYEKEHCKIVEEKIGEIFPKVPSFLYKCENGESFWTDSKL